MFLARVGVLVSVIALLGAFFSVPNAGAATPAFVQLATREVTGGTSNALTFPSANAAGNTLVLYVVWSNSSAATVADSRGNVYHPVAAATTWDGTAHSQVFYASGIAAGSNTVTVTVGSAVSYLLVYAHEYSGIDAANPIDGQVAAAGSGTTLNSGTLTTTNASDLLFLGAVAKDHMTSGATPSYTTRSTFASNLTADKNVSTAGSYTASATQANGTWAMHLVGFRASGATSPTPTNTPAPISTPVPATATPSSGTGLYPVRVSANHRYLVDAQNQPFLMLGDSPQSLIGNLSLAEADAYFANRQTDGFNTVWINLLCNAYTYCNSDGTTFDGIRPFTTPGDISTPNPTYFAKVDQVLQLAANHGLLVVLDPAETGGWAPTFVGQGATKAYNYGAFLGQRYKNQPNIIWMGGNDWQDWGNAFNDNVMVQVNQGIKDNDPNHIHTVELNYQRSDSTDDSRWLSLISLNAAYTYFPTYDYVLRAYNAAVMPVFMVEANYEFENNTGNDQGTPALLRKQLWWTMTSGAIGQIYGNLYTVRFQSGWQQNLDTPGALQQKLAGAFLSTVPWWTLVPDQQHQMLTGGFGTYDADGTVHGSNYAAAAKSVDGTLGLIYAPQTTTLQVNMTAFSGPVTATWFDPATGATTSAGSFGNAGSQSFATPGGHADGATDWVLLLKTGGSPQPTATPIPPTSTAVLPTSTPVPPTATPIPTSTPSVARCRAWISVDGGPGQWVAQPDAFCGL